MSANLQAFVAVVRSGTVQGASKIIGLTQTGITQRIKVLEADIGASLFTRSRRGMLLTEAGESLFRYCKIASEVEGATLAKIRGSGSENDLRLRITSPTSITVSRVNPALLELEQYFPNLLLSVSINDSPIETVERLKKGQTDFAVLPPEYVEKEFDSKILKSERYVLVGSPKWKGRKLDKILSQHRIIDFDEYDQTSFRYHRHFGFIDLIPKTRHFINNNEALVQAVSSGVGYGVLTEEVARSSISSGTVILLNGGKVLENRLALAWYPRPFPPLPFEKFIRAMK